MAAGDGAGHGAVNTSKGSKNERIAKKVRRRDRREWPASVTALAGAWKDFPSMRRLREGQPQDSVREKV